MVSFFQRRGFSRPSLPAIVLQILWATALILCLTTTAVAQEGFTFVTFDVPGAAKALYVRGINDAGTIVGNYQDQAGFFHSFLLSNGVPITFDVPQATETNALGINASGEIVGTYTDQANTFHGFLLRGWHLHHA